MKCERCEAEGAERRPQKTAYVDEERNYATLCEPCQKDADDYWDDKWAEYYAGCM